MGRCYDLCDLLLCAVRPFSFGNQWRLSCAREHGMVGVQYICELCLLWLVFMCYTCGIYYYKDLHTVKMSFLPLQLIHSWRFSEHLGMKTATSSTLWQKLESIMFAVAGSL